MIVRQTEGVTTKAAIIIFSDPKHTGEEAIERRLDAMSPALELKAKGLQAELLLQGAGVRWPAEIVCPEHPAHALFQAVSDIMAGICVGYVDAFDATDSAAATGLQLIRQKAITGTFGIAALSRYLDDGYRLVTF